MKKILITWGLWYIGSHVTIQCMKEGYEVVILDNLSNSSLTTLHEIEQIVGKKPIFFDADMRDIRKLEQLFSEHNDIEWVLHLAWYKSNKESCEKPYEYYDVNINGTIRLLYMLNKYNITKIVFASTANVYDFASTIPPFVETDKVKPLTPLATTKLIVEQILSDIAKHKYMNSVTLRIFTTIGADKSGLIGDSPKKHANLASNLSKVALGQRDKFALYGKDFATEDGSAIKDFIHVDDVASAFIHSYVYLETFEKTQKESDDIEFLHGVNEIFNIASWMGSSVLEITNTMEQITEQRIPIKVEERKEWEVAVLIGNSKKAQNILWRQSQKTPFEALQDHWNFVTKHH